MKIRPPEDELLQTKAAALLSLAFPKSTYEKVLIEKLRKKHRELHEWVALHRNRVIGYIAFSVAYKNKIPCGLHLAPLAVHPDHQNEGVGAELILFALRQPAIRDKTVFVLGNPEYYQSLGFSPCKLPICPSTKNNKNFMVIRPSTEDSNYTVGYEPEF